jgi:hypothetical protein
MNTNRILLALVFVASAALSASAQDKITWKDDRAVTDCTVVSINYTQIKYRLGSGGEQEDDARLVKDITFDTDTPTIPYEFNNGLSNLRKGAAKEAIEQFEKAIAMIKKSNSPNHPVRDFCRKHIMEAHRADGNAMGLIAAARELRKEKPDSFFLRESFVMQYEAAKATRKKDLQEETIKEMDAIVRSDSKFQKLNREVELLRADMLELNKDYRSALETYKRLGGEKDLWQEVSLGMLRCLWELKQIPDLKAKVESLMSTELREKRDSAPRVWLGTIIARGDVAKAEGKLKEALLDYTKAALDPGQAEHTPEHEAALAKAAKALAETGKQFGEKDKPNKTIYIDRAKEMRDELKRSFPNSGFEAEVNAAITDAQRGQ